MTTAETAAYLMTLRAPRAPTRRRSKRQVLNCSVAGCERIDRQMQRGMCRVHYRRWRHHGTTDLYVHLRPSPAERLTAGLVLALNGCLEWTGHTDRDGYGRIQINGKPARVHRFAWELANGPIPDGLSVLHHCDNPPCGQTEPTEGYPDGHLFLGTHVENMADRSAKGRRRKEASRAARTQVTT